MNSSAFQSVEAYRAPVSYLTQSSRLPDLRLLPRKERQAQPVNSTASTSYFTTSSSGVIQTFDAQAVLRLGYTSADIYGQAIFVLFHAQERSRLRTAWNAFLRQPDRVWQDRFDLVTKQGNRIPTQVTGRILQGNQQPIVLLECIELFPY